jgi:asparagine synthase (glutamine-hydrolysing)
VIAFAGIFSLDGEPVDPRQVHELAGAAPGAEGHVVDVWAHGPVGLGAARAPSAPHPQPLSDAESGCVLVFDGRIDNRDEIRASLSGSGRPGPRHSDAALVLAAYLKWGSEAPGRLLGDFAFAAWDARLRRLVLARDPVAMRPLFFSRLHRHVIFGSTLEQLFRRPDIAGEVDDDAAISYLYLQRLRLRRSFFRDAEPLLGGRIATVDDRGVRIRRYWHWSSEPPPFRRATGAEREEFRALFEDAVGRRLDGPGPVAVMLSGGLDSSAIAAMAGALDPGSVEVRTYSARFHRFPSADESDYAKAVVRRYGFSHTWIDGDECWPLSTFEGWLPVFTEPFFDPYPVLYHGFELASRDGVHSALTGFGGDSVLIGTPGYLSAWLFHGRWRDLHRQLRALARARRHGYVAQLAARGILPLLPTRVLEAIELHRRELKTYESWMPPHVRRRLREERRPIVFGGPNGWWRSLHYDLASTSDSPQQAYFDRLGRLFGLELRTPMIDARLIEFALRTPPDAFHLDGRTRIVQRAALADVLPLAVRERETKSSILPLMAYGIRERRRSFVAELLRDSELERRGYVLPGTWTSEMERYLERGGRLPSWFALTLELWLRHREGRLPELR